MIGQTISHYRILQKLGAGGMGVVYKARDSNLRRFVAIKVLPPETVADKERKRRFVREARAASALNHPNIVTIYDIDRQDGVDYIAMELVQGRTLRQLIERGQLDLSTALRYAMQIADALAKAHSAGIVHRDLKPSNIMVSDDGLVKILDFGLAKLAESAAPAEDQSTLTLDASTEEGRILGTPAYMSPEQAAGKRVDARSDIFTFGAVLYEMLAGRSAFQKESWASTLAAIESGEPEPLDASLPHDLDRIVKRCLRKDPAHRFQHAGDLKLALEEVNEPSGSAGRSGLQEPVRPTKFRPLWPAALAIAAALAVASAFLWQRAQAKPLTERDWIVLADFVNNTGDTVFDGALKQALSVQLNQSPYLNIVPDGRVEAALRRMGLPPEQRLTKSVAREVCQREEVKALLAGSISAVGSRYSIALDASNCGTGETLAQEQAEAANKERVLAALGQAASRIRRKLGESLGSVQKLDTPIAQATTPSMEALQAYSRGWESQNKGRYREAMAFYRHAVELDPGFALAYRAMGAIHNNSGEWDLAEQCRSKAYELRRRTSERERLFIEADYCFAVQRDLERAIDAYAIYTQMYPRDPTALRSWGISCSNLGQHDKAAELYRDSMRVSKWSSPVHYTNLAAACRRLNRLAEARALLEEAAAKFDSPGTHGGLYLLAHVEGDTAAMQRELEWFHGKAEEHSILAEHARATDFRGQFRKGREIWKSAIDMARGAGARELQASYFGARAEDEALVGCFSAARDAAAESLRLNPTLINGPALALALAGSAARAQEAARELLRVYPRDTLLNHSFLPSISAAIEMQRGNPRRAVEILRTARYEFSSSAMPLLYLRGEASRQAGNGEEAEAAFQAILAHRGIFVGVVYPLAYLGLGRARTLAGNIPEARKAYQEFFGLWKDADPDLPVLKQARREYADLVARAGGV